MRDVWIGCLVDVLGGGDTSSLLLTCDDCLLDGEDGWWSLPSLSLLVDDGGVGGREKPDSTLMLSFGKTDTLLCCWRALPLDTRRVGCLSKLCGWAPLLVCAIVLCSWYTGAGEPGEPGEPGDPGDPGDIGHEDSGEDGSLRGSSLTMMDWSEDSESRLVLVALFMGMQG